MTFKIKIMTKLVGGSLVASLAAVFLAAVPAHAATETTTADIESGSDAALIGTATFTRTSSDDGSESLSVHLSVAGGITESHICLSDAPFTSRASAGQCPYSQGNTGAAADYTIPVGTTYAGRAVYVQAHVVNQGNTAYAGWQPGKPFFGNVAVAAAADETPVPPGAAGGIGLAVLVALGMIGAKRWRSAAQGRSKASAGAPAVS